MMRHEERFSFNNAYILFRLQSVGMDVEWTHQNQQRLLLFLCFFLLV